MYLSFEGGKMTSTLVNIDLEEMCFCLSQAVLIHIDNGDHFYESQISCTQLDSDQSQEDYSDEFDSSEEEMQERRQIKKSLLTISEKTIENTNE
jgi:hypothetical protein